MESQHQKLLQFVTQRIDHSHNPQSFRYQLQAEINHHLKQEELHLKHQRIRARNQLIQEQQLKRREQLQSRLQKKGEKTSQNKEKRLEERVKSMAELRRKKEEYTASRLQESRREQLKRSLQKIQQFQKERQDLLTSKLTKPQNSVLSKSLSLSRLQRRNQGIDAKYEAMVGKLQAKGIFSDPASRLSELYAQRAKIFRQRSSQISEDTANKIGAKLSKIEEARERKETLLRQRTEKLKQQDAFHQKIKKAKIAQIEAFQRTKRKKMQSEQARRLMRLQSLKGISKDNIFEVRSAIFETERYRPQKKSSSFRKQIRRHIEEYKLNH